MSTRIRLSCGAFLVAAFIASPGYAASITVYTSLGDWTSAVNGTTVVEDFSSAVLNTSAPLFDTLDNLCDGFSVRSSIQGATLAGGAYGDSVNWGVGFGGPEDAPLFEFSSGTSAFGADWNLGPLAGGLRMWIAFADGSTTSAVMANPFAGTYAGFFGIAGDSSITSIRLSTASFGSTAGQSFTMDNARLLGASSGSLQAVPTPEPATLALMGIAACIARITRRKRTS